MDMWALNLKAGGPCLTPRQTPPATSSPLAAAGEIGSLAVGPTRLWRQPARWPRLVVNASGWKSKNSRDDEDRPKNRASSTGSRDAYDGPFGIILNRPLYTTMKHVNPSFSEQATPFGDCSLLFGGPVDMSIFLMWTTAGKPLKGFEEVVPGVCFGLRTDLEKASALMTNGVVKPEDLKFYVGYSAWDHDQLLSEIDAGYWVVTSCSSGLITDAMTTDPTRLRTEILQLMGGHYSELSKKPKEDGM
ncbi:hypothetical protein PR202_ga08701 [Eleusine coracana subsp. coracana]|uniref:Uncharacterized protein n=1 Tax=Eleusine coracana subsp. coracana TaxID=191504 RepID=A0AAV5C2F4_ELECO|nr:hypothetical protein PR202_ga08701 [Eleusine coracana subsp. coracana]